MVLNASQSNGRRVFGVTDWTSWVDRMARSLFAMSAEEFEEAIRSGEIDKSGIASDLASLMELVAALRTSGPATNR